jgi:hypothetical protein
VIAVNREPDFGRQDADDDPEPQPDGVRTALAP